MTDHVTTLPRDAGAVPADLVECLAAIGRSMPDEFGGESIAPSDLFVGPYGLADA